MKKVKKIVITFLIILIVIVIVLALYMLITNTIKNSKIRKINEYRDKVLNSNNKPNVVVARVNGQEILQYEVELKQKQLDNYDEPNTKDKNAFYEVVVQKLMVEYAQENAGKSSYNIDYGTIEKKNRNEISNYTDWELDRLLDVLSIKREELWMSKDEFIEFMIDNNIELMLRVKADQIISNEIGEKYTFIDDLGYNIMLFRFKLENEKTNKNIQEGKLEQDVYKWMQEYSNKLMNLREEYIKDLVCKAKIELYIDKKTELEYSTYIKKEYIGLNMDK